MSPFHSDVADWAGAAATARPLAIDDGTADLLFRQARTAYRFTDEPVTEEQARAIMDLVKWGPTAMNGQPLRVTFVRSPEARERLISALAPGNRAKAASAPLIAILAYDVDFHETLPEVFPHAVGARDRFADEEARHRFATFNGALQAGYFVVAVRAAGLAAGPLGGFDAAAVDAHFHQDGRWRAFLVVNIGHPAPDAHRDRLPRLDYGKVVAVA